jgi:hypothetical protein
VEAMLGNEKFAKTFTERFKPLPDYSHDMDAVRTKAKEEKDAEYQTWHQTELEKYDTYVAGIDKLKAYEAKYGPLDAEGQKDFLKDNNRGGGNVLSKEDIDKMMLAYKAEVEAQFGRRDKATLDYIEVRENHMTTFKKPLDVKTFESQWKEHPEWGGDLRLAYEKFVSPEMEKVREAEMNKKMEERYNEGLRDGFSRKVIPSDSRPNQFSPMFDKDVKIEKMNESEAEAHSRASFFEGLTEKQPA